MGSNRYLLDNFNIVSYSMGYSVKKFLKVCGLSRKVVSGKPAYAALSTKTIECIDDFIRKNSPGKWMDELYEMCKAQKLDRVEAVRFGSQPISGAFQKNTRALRFFFHISATDVAKLSYLSGATISAYENGSLYTDTTEFALLQVFVKLSKGDRRLQSLVNKACHYPILNKIPKSMRVEFRRNYMPNNETQDK